MKSPFLALVCLFLMTTIAYSQKDRVSPSSLVQQEISKGTVFKQLQLNSSGIAKADAQNKSGVEKALNRYHLFTLDKQTINEIKANRSAGLDLSLAVDDARSLQVLLVPVNIFTDDFSVITQNGSLQVNQGMHYRGIIKGNEKSLVSLSIFDNEVMGFISLPDEGNYVVGRLQQDNRKGGLHVIYNDRALKAKPSTTCFTDDGIPQAPSVNDRDVQALLTTRCVRLYYETEYDMFQNKGSAQAVINYVTGLHNQVATLYSNDEISTGLSQIFVWTSADPYNGSSTIATLNQFQNTRTSFNGDLGQLLTFRSLGGGVAATINGICKSNSQRLCMSAINSTYSNVPTYSWTVEVTTHEFGHLFGSAHTHACAWNGNNTAIDGCGPAAGYNEGCNAALPPAGGGTIMSYCHLVSSVGISFANGFGPQPAQRIRNTVEAASCLGTNCGGGGSCAAPNGLAVSNVTTTSATVSWAAASGAVSYNVDYKTTASSTWTNAATGTTNTSVNLSGLATGTTYDWRVLSNCGSSSSVYSSAQFTTLGGGCVTAYEPNESLSAAASVATNTALSAAISSTTDKDWYRFTLSTTSNLNITLTNLPDDYDIILYNSAGTELSRSEQPGTNNETIVRNNTAAGTYYVQVFGYDGAFSTTVCYNLNIGATAVGGGCASTYDQVSNNTFGTAVSIPLNTNINGLISPSSDNDYYKFTLAAGGPITITLTNLPADYDIRLYNSGQSQVAISQAGGTSSETINYNAAAGNYYIRVYGYSGANNSTQCYNLRVASGSGIIAGNSHAAATYKEAIVVNKLYAVVAPNPVKDVLKLNITGVRDNITANIVDAYGRILVHRVVAEGINSFDVQHLAAGVYFIRLNNKNGVQYQTKFVKQ